MDIIDTIKDKELKAALTALRTQKRGRPPKRNKGVTTVPDGKTKVCLNVPTEKINKIREIAYLETTLLKTLVEEGLDYIIERYEKEHGTIIPNPDHQINIRKE